MSKNNNLIDLSDNKNHTTLDRFSVLKKEIKDLEDEVFKVKQENGIRDKEKNLIRKKCKLREITIIEQYDKFIKHYTDTIQQAVYLNKGVLHLAVGSYYDDIHRYKDYSGSRWANQHKQAAYTIEWVAKFKPIQIREQFDNEIFINDEILDINLSFALVCGFAFLDEAVINLLSDEKKMIDIFNSKQTCSVNKKQSFYDKFLYNLRYRPFNGKQLLFIFEAFELNITNQNLQDI